MGSPKLAIQRVRGKRFELVRKGVVGECVCDLCGHLVRVAVIVRDQEGKEYRIGENCARRWCHVALTKYDRQQKEA